MINAIKVLAAKKEAVYGTDILPTLAANAILTRNFQAQPIEVDRLERPLDRGTFGGQASRATNERQTLSFEIEMAGSGAAGTAPRWMEIMEACGMTPPSLVAGDLAQQAFALQTQSSSSLSTRHWMGNQLRKAVGVRGTWSVDMTAGAVPFFAFSMTGLLPAATPFGEENPVGADFTSFQEPLEVNSANTAITLDGYNPRLRSLRLDANVETAVRNLVGSRYINRGNHSVSGQLVIETPTRSAKDYIASLRAGALLNLGVTHGTVAGNIVQLSSARTQITSIAESEEDNKVMWTLGVALSANVGGDELFLTAK